MYKHISFFLLAFFVSPLVSFADAFDVVDLAISAFSSVIPLFVTLATVVFLWGVVRFVAHADDEKAVAEGKEVMTWGLVSLFVIVSLWGIVGFVADTIDLTDEVSDPISIPIDPL